MFTKLRVLHLSGEKFTLTISTLAFLVGAPTSNLCPPHIMSVPSPSPFFTLVRFRVLKQRRPGDEARAADEGITQIVQNHFLRVIK